MPQIPYGCETDFRHTYKTYILVYLPDSGAGPKHTMVSIDFSQGQVSGGRFGGRSGSCGTQCRRVPGCIGIQRKVRKIWFNLGLNN